MLEQLGLDPAQAAVYRALVARPSADAGELATATGVSSTHVEEVLAQLGVLGLVARQGADSGRAVASPPGLALRAMLAEQERRMAAVRAGLEELEQVYRASAARRTSPDVVDLVLGTESVRQRVAQVQAGARREVLAFVRAGQEVVSAEENQEEERALERGVTYRVVVEREVAEAPGFIAAVTEAAQWGEEVRVVPRLASRMLIVDRELALLPMHPSGGERHGAVLVRASSLLDLLLDVFDSVWAGGTPVLAAEDSAPELDELDTALLRLLLMGMTDSRIAGQLEVSARTVQRRVSALMDLAAIDTRFQLGVHAVRRGWI